MRHMGVLHSHVLKASLLLAKPLYIQLFALPYQIKEFLEIKAEFSTAL